MQRTIAWSSGMMELSAAGLVMTYLAGQRQCVNATGTDSSQALISLQGCHIKIERCDLRRGTHLIRGPAVLLPLLAVR